MSSALNHPHLDMTSALCDMTAHLEAICFKYSIEPKESENA